MWIEKETARGIMVEGSCLNRTKMHALMSTQKPNSGTRMAESAGGWHWRLPQAASARGSRFNRHSGQMTAS